MTISELLALAFQVAKEPDTLVFVLLSLTSFFLWRTQVRLRRDHVWCVADMHEITGIMLDAVTALAGTTGGKREKARAELDDIRKRIQALFENQAKRTIEGEK